MIRPVAAAEGPALAGFLSAHEEGAMFPLAALHRGEVLPPGAALPTLYAMHGWVLGAPGQVTGFLGLSRAGYLLPQAPGADWRPFRALLAGSQVAAAVGPAGQVPPLLAALGLQEVPRRSDKAEPGFALDLAGLRVPPAEGFALAPPDAGTQALVAGWRAAYLQELSNLSADEAAPVAAADVGRWIAAGSHRLLLHHGRPVALAGFNARLPEVVQVGGVYVPPELRGRGYARRAVALHLAEARAAGLRRAVLFAASDAAAAAYRAIGFRPKGVMAIVEFADPATVPAP